MGAWGYGGFENDAVLDFAAEQLTSREGVLRALSALRESSHYEGDILPLAFGAATVVALARSGSKRFQSQGTTLLANAAGESDPVLYLPAEVAEFLESGQASFDGEAVRLALDSLDLLSASISAEGWDDPIRREQAIERVRLTLRESLTS